MIELICGIALIFYIVSPYFLTKATKKFKLEAILSDVIICYLAGMVIGNCKGKIFSPEINEQFTNFGEQVANYAVLLALPILIISTKISDIIKNIRPIFLSFFLVVACVVCASVFTAYYYRDAIENGHKVAGMMGAVYIGGTPNMISLSKAFNLTDTLFPIMQATDLFCSGIYILFLTSIARKVYGWFLPPYIPHEVKDGEIDEYALLEKEISQASISRRTKELLKSAAISIVIIILSVLSALVIPNEFGGMNQIILMITLTTLSVIVCGVWGNRTSQWITTTSSANYILLIFAVAAGSISDFGMILDKGADYLGFNALLFVLALVLHLILGIIFRIRVDILIISSVASIFGPGFLPQISYVLGHTRLLAAGIAAGILGFIIANYIGLGIMEYCKMWYS